MKRIMLPFNVAGRFDFKYFIITYLLSGATAYWDVGTTTIRTRSADSFTIRCSRFRWMKSESDALRLFYPGWDWYELSFRRRLYVIAGITHDLINLGTATILNARTLITAANYLDPYMDKQTELRIWALGRNGRHDTPWRYRVWRVTRLFPRSVNPEHCHGPYCYHTPRHDIALIHSYDQMYVYTSLYHKYAYAFRGFLPHKNDHFSSNDMWYAGSGFQNLQHIYENYKILYARTRRSYVVDCSKYLPKWWGKFICVVNHANYAGLQNGGSLFHINYIFGIASFEIRYNEDRIMVFTDIRYYISTIYLYAQIVPGEYYEYAYPQWGVRLNFVFDGSGNMPWIPSWQIKDDMYPMGKKR